MDFLTWEIGGEYVFGDIFTCVAFSVHPDEICDSGRYVCTANKAGTLANQGVLLLEAIQNGGVHPHCPSTLNECDFSLLIARAPHDCVQIFGKLS